MVGNHFPRWETVSHAGKSCSTASISSLPSLQTPSPEKAVSGHLHKGGAAFGNPSFVDIPMDGCLEARQAGNPTVENDFPPWGMVQNPLASRGPSPPFLADPKTANKTTLSNEVELVGRAPMKNIT